jgi:hypothetical protein
MLTDDILLDKKQVLASLDQLPDQVSSEALIERILFLKLIESRLRDTSKTTPNEQVMAELKDMLIQRRAEEAKHNR